MYQLKKEECSKQASRDGQLEKSNPVSPCNEVSTNTTDLEPSINTSPDSIFSPYEQYFTQLQVLKKKLGLDTNPANNIIDEIQRITY